jgi:hypothetical protein
VRATTIPFAACLALASATCSPAEDEAGAAAAPDPAKPVALFDGKSLGGWKVIEGFAGGGEVRVEEGAMVLDMGETLTGVVWGKTDPYPFPLINYEIRLQARRLMGTDFFCGLTFPVGDLKTSCTLVLGGWGGGLVGISSLDRLDASENDTSSHHKFEQDQWYTIRLQVQQTRFVAFIDDKKVINTIWEGRKPGMRFGDIEYCAPLGLSTYQTRSAIKDITMRPLRPEEVDTKPY